MSGYLEVKYPFKSNLGLSPFKSWKRQWCILRPSPTFSGGSLAVYCSEAGAAAGSVDLPSGCVVRRAKSRTRPHAFAVFFAAEPRKPRVLLAAPTLQDAHSWMEKIRALLNANNLGTEALLKDSYSVSVITTELARKCGLSGADGVATLSSNGLLLSRSHKHSTFLQWKHINDVLLTNESADKSSTCVLSVDSDYPNGGGELKLTSPLACELVTALREALRDTISLRNNKKLSKSEGDLRSPKCSDNDLGEMRRSWYSGPSEVSLDDIDLVMSKECKRLERGQLSRCAGAGHLAPELPPATAPAPAPAPAVHSRSIASFDDSMCDRRSLISIASGIYEEIPDLPEGDTSADTLYCKMSQEIPIKVELEEPMYECVVECAYASMRRARRPPPAAASRASHPHPAPRPAPRPAPHPAAASAPPPLPPRLPFGTTKLGSSWNCRVATEAGVTRHSSLGSLPRCCSTSTNYCKTNTLPKLDKRQPFSVFRKRLKSDSRIASPKSETSKENKGVETKKKKFDFTPTRDIFKSFKVSRKLKNLKISNGNLSKGETKSCEFLDDTEHVTTNRCSKSVECLEHNDEYIDEFDADLSIEYNNDAIAALSLPQEIVELILGRDQINKIRLKDQTESEYMPMSPIVPAPMEHHYIVMSPRTKLA